MAMALIGGFERAGLISASQVRASDVLPAALEHLQKQTGVHATFDNQEVVANSEVVFLAVKPQVMSTVLAELKPVVGDRHLVVSIAAGITLRQLGKGLGERRRIIRVMPNTPCLVGASASGYCRGGTATEEDGQLVQRLLRSVGVAFELPESLLDAVTGLSGSGPAFIALVIEALSDGGVRMGLPREVATALAAQTVLGTGKMVIDQEMHPAQLKDMVSSAGGTTIAGIHALERAGLRAALIDAVEAATLRSKELADQAGPLGE